MEYSWNSRGILREDVWNICGICEVYGICMQYVWNVFMHRICMECLTNIDGICEAFHEIFIEYVRHMCVEYIWSMSGICMEYL